MESSLHSDISLFTDNQKTSSELLLKALSRAIPVVFIQLHIGHFIKYV